MVLEKKNRHICQGNGIEVSYINLYTYGHLIFENQGRNTHWKKNSSSLTKSVGQTVCLHVEESIVPYTSVYTNLNFTWVKFLTIKPDTIYLIEWESGISLELISRAKVFLNRTPLAHTQKAIVNKWAHIKLKCF